MLSAGSLVAGYRIERVLGVGGMGAVYLAANPTLPRFDALKVLSPELSRDADFRARFTREADVAAALQHPQIVAVYNRGQTDDGQLWIAMQYVAGTDADDALRAGTMTPQRAVHIIGEVAKALDFAHQHHVVHRDIKPANFLLSGPVGASEQVLLGDFGIARALDDVSLTATGSVMATAAYAAPEVLSGMRFDGRADIYSLGCTLFRLLTGKTPFWGSNGPAGVMLAHLQRPPPRATDLVQGLPPALDHVIATAMAKDPGARFSSAAELAQAAAAALRDPTLALRPPLPPVATSEVVSYPHMFGTSGAPWWQQDSPRTMGGPPAVSPPMGGHPVYASAPPAPRKRRRAIAVGAGAAVLAVVTVVAVAVWPSHDSAGTQPAPQATQSDGAPAPSGEPTAPALAPVSHVDPAQLRPILLTANQLPQSGGAQMALEADSTSLADDSATLAPANKDCLGAWAPAQQQAYRGDGITVTGVAAQTMHGMNQQSWQDGVTQAVVSFESDDSAGFFIGRERGQWELCSGKSITVTPPSGGAQSWTFSPPVTTNGVITIKATLQTGGTCQHGMTKRANVMIDIRQCRVDGGTNVASLVTATAGKFPHQ